jgi:hypothetical protein
MYIDEGTNKQFKKIKIKSIFEKKCTREGRRHLKYRLTN